MPKFFSRRIGLNHRKSRRFSSTELILKVHLFPPLQKLELADISQGGLSFFYTNRPEPVPSLFEVDLSDGKGFHLGRVTVKKVSDEIFSELPNEAIVIRRLRARFIRISVVQEYDLKRYLDKIKP
ncbi:MAG: hypothetical protein PVG78_13120 [Desulfobacterales bacterium]|jgi:hypothetical protein